MPTIRMEPPGRERRCSHRHRPPQAGEPRDARRPDGAVPGLFHDGRGVQEDPIMSVSPGGGSTDDASRLNRHPTGRNADHRAGPHIPPGMKVTRSCAIRPANTVPFRCASRSGAGLKAPTGRLASVPFRAAPSGWVASPRDGTFAATGTSFRSSLRFGRNTPGPVLPVGAPPSRALSAGRLARQFSRWGPGAHATSPTGC